MQAMHKLPRLQIAGGRLPVSMACFRHIVLLLGAQSVYDAFSDWGRPELMRGILGFFLSFEGLEQAS